MHPPAPSHVAVQLAARPHDTRRSSPFGCGTQTPGDDGSAQVTHAPTHAESQQMPSTQNPDGHSAALEHFANEPVTVGMPPPGASGEPSGSVATSAIEASEAVAVQVLVVASQTPETQSPSLAQLALHDFASSAQTRPPGHGAAIGVGQAADEPVHAACESVAAAQSSAQSWTLGLNPQAPALQTSPHGPAPHFPCGSATPSRGLQVPLEPGRSHA